MSTLDELSALIKGNDADQAIALFRQKQNDTIEEHRRRAQSFLDRICGRKARLCGAGMLMPSP